MTIQEDFYALLAGVTSPQVAKVWPVFIPQGADYPAIQYVRVSSSRDMNFDEVENFVRTVFQVETYAEQYNSALDIAESIKSGLNNYSGGVIQRIRIDFEQEILEDGTDMYAVIQQFTVWHTET